MTSRAHLSGTITTITSIADPASGVVSQGRVAPSKNTIQPGTMTIDVLKNSSTSRKPVAGTVVLIGVGGGGGVDTPCSPTPGDQSLRRPDPAQHRIASSDVFLSQGCVAACDTPESFLQALVNLTPKFPDDPDAEQVYRSRIPSP